MDGAADERLGRLIERRKAELAKLGDKDGTHTNERRFQRNRVLRAIPRLTIVISGAIGEINDQIAEIDARIELHTADHSPTAEIGYTICLADEDDGGPILTLTVDHDGVARAILSSANARTLLKSLSVFDFEQADIKSLLISLLEAQYD